MRVVLRSAVPGLGRAGEQKDVADGYARNFLLPRGLAVEASAGELRRIERQAATERTKKERAHGDAEALAQRIAATRLTFRLKAGRDGRTFGSITSKDVVEALRRDVGIEVERTKVHLDEPLRSLGAHSVEIRLLSDVRARLPIQIEPEREPA